MANILAWNIAHDSSVAYLENGRLKFFCKEERLSRIKRDKHPFKSLELFRSLNLNPDHILYMTPTNNELDIFSTYGAYSIKFFGSNAENYSNLNHHSAHATFAFCNSGFEEALIFVIDRNGSLFFVKEEAVAREAESVYVASRKSKHISPIYKNFFLNANEAYSTSIESIIKTAYPRSCEVHAKSQYGIVTAYEAATTLIGQHPLENGKTMGLSSYCNKTEFEPLFYNGFVDSKYFMKDVGELNNSLKFLGVCFRGEHDKITQRVTTDNHQYYSEKAKHVQIETQKAAANLIRTHVNKTGIKNVCIVGGYGLNVVANQYYLQQLPDVNFYFEPCADDTGVSIGGAMLKHLEVTGDMPQGTRSKFYHHYEDDYNITGLGDKTTIKEIVEILQNQKSVAIFEGSPESGPRALGHRSILFDPRNSDTKNIVNKIKKREWYRPFAGVMLESDLNDYFEDLGINSSEDMTINFQALPDTVKNYPGVIHVDGSCRIQTVNSGFLFNLISQFKIKTGSPILLNTSFNLAGEPLVHYKKDAIHTFYNSDLDYLLFVDEMILLKK